MFPISHRKEEGLKHIIDIIKKAEEENKPIEFENLKNLIVYDGPHLSELTAKDYIGGLIKIKKITINEKGEMFLCQKQ